MKHIFVDFEMNPVDKKYNEERKVCIREIIEIGAVMLDEDYKEISSFKAYVKPQFNSKIYKKYEELTGISTDMIVGADIFEAAFKRFMAWCGKFDYEIYAWSNSDKEQVIKEMKLKNIKVNKEIEYMFEHWKDFQKIFGEAAGTKQPISLENALDLCGIPFSGRKHDAMFDARNTSVLYVESVLHDISESIASVKNYITDENDSSVSTLGDLFNFAVLKCQFA